jgi:hypothetical protein
MKISKILTFASSCLLVVSLSACGDDDDDSGGKGDAATSADAATANDAAAGNDAQTSQDAATGADAAASDAAASDAAASDAAASDAASDASSADSGTALTCSAYCTSIMANCTAANAQYPSMASCVNACAGYPVGAEADTSGNTLGCRTYHAGAASGNAGLHCPHAGPTGDGTCGTLCEGFCAIQATACTGALKQFTSASDCATKCAAFSAGAGKYNTSFTGGNTNYCRVYHLSVAASSAGSATDHCGHIAPTSIPCN